MKKTSFIILLLSGCYLIIDAQDSPELLTHDGAWCWFSDPRAIYQQGEKEQIYFGFINRQSDVLIGAKNLQTDEVHTYILHDTLEIDDHNVPSILCLPDGRLMVFYNEHNGHVYMRKSRFPEDISSWEDEQIICQSDETYRYCYTNPVQLAGENNRIYLIGRKVGPTSSFEHWWHYIKYSDDEGATWSEEKILLDNAGRKNPPYLKVATDHKNRIDLLFTDGHPKIGPDVSTYHMYYRNDSFFQTKGSSICTSRDLPVLINSIDKVYDAAPSQIRSWIWDIALKNGNPVVTYARYPSEQDHIYHYAYWDGTKWVDQQMVNSGSWMLTLLQGDVVREAHYSGGIVLDHQNPEHVYISRNIFGKFEIEHCMLRSDGEWESELLTNNSSKNNVRPYVVYGAPPDKTSLMWMAGDYRHYTEFNTQLILLSLK